MNERKEKNVIVISSSLLFAREKSAEWTDYRPVSHTKIIEYVSPPFQILPNLLSAKIAVVSDI